MNAALNYFSSRLAGYSSNVYTVQASGKTSSLVANDQIVLSLPSSAIIDARSLRIGFNLSIASTVAARAPANLEKLFARVECLVGGQSVSATNNSHGLLVAVKERVHGSEAGIASHPDIVRAVGDFSTVPIGATAAEPSVGTDAASGSAVYTTASVPYVVELTNTFLSSCEPRFIDSSLLNQIQIRITLASNSVLSVSTNNTVPSGGVYAAVKNPVEFDSIVAGQSATYQIDNLTASITAISFSSSEYDTLLASQLSEAGFLSVPFRNFLTYRQTHTGSSKFQLSTRSLDKVYFAFLYGGATEQGTTTRPTLKNSTVQNSPNVVPGYLVADTLQASKFGAGREKYRGSWETFGLPSTQFQAQLSINNSFTPQGPVGPSQLGSITELATGVALPASTTQLARLTTDFVSCFSFALPGSSDYRVASGIDFRGQNSACQLLTTGTFDIGTTPAWDSFIVCEMCSEMRISVGRSVSIIM